MVDWDSRTHLLANNGEGLGFIVASVQAGRCVSN